LKLKLLVVLVCVVIAACSSSSSTGGPVDAGNSSSSGGAHDSGSSSGSLVQDSGSLPDTSIPCPNGPLCAGSCCNANALCVTDMAGNQSCAIKCTTGADCTSAASPCCAVIPGVKGTQVCLPNDTVAGQQCACAKTTDCTSGCCAPVADSTGNPIGPYVCKPADGKPYDCSPDTACAPTASCSSGYCPIQVTGNGSCVCSEPCTNSSQCGTGGGTCATLMNGTCNTAPGACLPPAGP